MRHEITSSQLNKPLLGFYICKSDTKGVSASPTMNLTARHWNTHCGYKTLSTAFLVTRITYFIPHYYLSSFKPLPPSSPLLTLLCLGQEPVGRNDLQAIQRFKIQLGVLC